MMLALAVPLWGVGIAGICRGWDWRAMSLVHDAAVSALVIAGMCWAAAWIHDDQQEALIRQNADLWRRIPEGDRPPLLRHAR